MDAMQLTKKNTSGIRRLCFSVRIFIWLVWCMAWPWSIVIYTQYYTQSRIQVLGCMFSWTWRVMLIKKKTTCVCVFWDREIWFKFFFFDFRFALFGSVGFSFYFILFDFILPFIFSSSLFFCFLFLSSAHFYRSHFTHLTFSKTE